MTEQPKPWKAEYARSSRATCKTCSNKIASNEFRIARVIPAVQFDGFMTVWHHANCLLKKPKQFKLLDEVEGVDNLRWEDQQVLQKYLEGGPSEQDGGKDDGESKPNADINDYAIENAKSSRATCKACNEKIGKGDVRVSKMEPGSGRFRGKTPSWRHIKCFLKSGEWVNPLEEIPGWEELSRDDQKDIKAILKSTNKGSKQESASGEEPPRTSKRIIKPDANKEETKTKKRQKKSTEDDENAKKKSKQSVDTGRLKSTGFEAQSKGLWAIKDNLSKHVSSAEMKEMLAANSQNDSGSEYDLRERCADGMMFGALEKCPMCGGHVEYHSGLYKCMGFMSAWSKCSYKSETHERSKTKWKVPEDTSNKYLLEWYKKQKLPKPARLLLPQRPSSKETAETDADAPAGSFLKGLGICLIGKLGKSKANWQEIIEGAGGHLHAYPKSDTSCVIINEAELEKDNRNIQQAVALKVPVLKEEFLTACMDKRTKLPFSDYVVEAVTMLPATTKVKVKGRSSVHEDSGLQDTGHILEEGKVIYNTTLNLSDLSTGINSYYILQIIEDDHKKSHHIFRKWGRVGNASIGGQKIEKMSKNSAIAEFKKLFREKTGNDWEHWGKKDGFKKNPGKFFPLEIDYGADEVGKSELVKAGSKSKLDQRLVELLKMLFDIETYRAAMMEFEINMSEMPLGKLSKGNIEQGFHVLTEIQSILATDEPVAARKDALLMDASNRFFTIIPSIHPIIIRDEKNLKTKIEMLEALRDIEIASHFMNLTNEEAEEDPIDVNYKKLHCELSPLPRDGVEYQLIGKYLQRTHAPTHKEWSLHLEDVFVVDRNGESAAFAPFKESLGNHMLLWHGSRTTNYVGILSQGLRIAPPEAPVTGYMFGKGIYFADLVSKSAQYCYTTKSSPIGLMLLSEVALGEMKEFKTAKYMEKPPSGFDSTKGLGQMKPKEAEYETLENDVVVPCGVPVPSGVKGTSLLYNEYIVYNQSQAKLRYLLKVRFQHKR